jgi:hypothetical protein
VLDYCCGSSVVANVDILSDGAGLSVGRPKICSVVVAMPLV